ncbi:glycosyltransferase [Pelagicoccus sp. SDUM812003]|uniref:glycosyltransferase family protein n=1 Tax=Pelagicoccus sp. SDUM812003 TaxID=3041267 RepID=UPI0028127610|nr:glycosyltransferase [Pelagicoccus sp. SDUM812003]
MLENSGYSAVHMFYRGLREAGHEARLLIPNAVAAQGAWAAEKGLREPQFPSDENRVLFRQVAEYQPEVVFIGNPVYYDDSFVSAMQRFLVSRGVPLPDLVCGWCGAITRGGFRWTSYDLILSGLTPMRRYAERSLGAKATEDFGPSFPAWLELKDEMVPETPGVVFAGSWLPWLHQGRNAKLASLAKRHGEQGYEWPLRLHLRAQLPDLPDEIFPHLRPAKFGFEMQRLWKEHAIVLDYRGDHLLTHSGEQVDLAGGDTINMRLFEVTGAGGFLLAEDLPGVRRFFEPGKEIDVFGSEEELVDKIEFYLSRPELRRKVAEAGRARCLKEYGSKARTSQLREILERHRSAAIARVPALTEKRRFELGKRMFAEGQWSEGLSEVKRAVDSGHCLPKWRWEFANLLAKSGRFEDAKRAAQQELAYHGSDPEIEEALQRWETASPRDDAMSRERRGWESGLPESVHRRIVRASRTSSYRGEAFGKTPFDMAILMRVLEDTVPEAVFELGSGGAGSALWLGDVAAAAGLPTKVVSVGEGKLDAGNSTRVKFLQGNARALDRLPELEAYLSLSHPWVLALGDWGASLASVLAFFHPLLKEGDVLAVDESVYGVRETEEKEVNSALRDFMAEHPREYEVLVHYCDFFGPNYSASPNSYWRRL